MDGQIMGVVAQRWLVESGGEGGGWREREKR